MEKEREQLRQWLRSILAAGDETPSALARRAGLATTTLTRFLNNADSPILGTRTIAKICHVTGAEAPGSKPSGLPQILPTAAQQFDEDSEPFRSDEQPEHIVKAVKSLIDGRNAVDPWQLRTDALELMGYLPGDILLVGLNVTPHAGNIVCAQVYQWDHRRSETVFRIYEPPYLVAASNKPMYRRPLLVDNNTVVIKGVALDMLRPSRAA